MNLTEITDSQLIQKTNLSRKLTIGGKTIAYPVYRVRLDLLFYNDKNDRIASWLTQYNSDSANVPFDCLEREEYNRIIEGFIIESNPTAIEKTKNNIALVNQREPGVVLFDGRIIDGNRRFTCLRMLHRNDPEVNYFETVILPAETGSNQKQIKMLELSIQHGEEQRVEYNLIDLTVGAYHDIVETKLLTIQEYAGSTNETIAEVRKRLDIAELVIDFLEYIHMPKQYHVAREMQVYSMFYEAIPLLKRCESAADKESLRTSIYNNMIMGSAVDHKKFIRNVKHMMDEGVYGSFIRRQNQVHEKIAEAMEDTQLHSVKDIEQFAKVHEDLSEDLSAAMDGAVTRMKKAQSRAKPSQAVTKSLSMLMEIDADMLDILSDSERSKLNKQIGKLNDALSHLNAACSEEGEAVAAAVTESAPKQPERLFLAPVDITEPMVYCCDAGKKITNLNFALHFNALRYTEQQKAHTHMIAYFMDANGAQLCPFTEIDIAADAVTKANFSLKDSSSALAECYLVLKYENTPPGDAVQCIRFEISIAFSVDFNF